MITTEVQELDAATFAALHESLAEQSAAAGSQERRDDARHPFDCQQLIAPFDGTTMQSSAAFQHVRCRDLSQHGFSFVTPARPHGELLIAALGNVPFKYFVAQIVRVTSDRGPAGVEFSIGCRFLRRLA